MRQNYLKGTASFIIALILTLPIYSSFVFAALSNGYVYGETDKIKGYYRRNENAILNITAKISGDTITPSQVHLFDLSGPGFNTCTDKGDGSYYCTYQMYSNSITQNPSQLSVKLYNDNNRLDSSFTISGAFDEIAPEIKSFTITPQTISQGNINFQYNVYDHSYSETDSNRCSGIKKIELSHNGFIFRTNEINSLPNHCSYSRTITVPLSNITDLENGVIEVLLTAYDNFNQPSYATSQFNYDSLPPIISLDSLDIKDNEGNSIENIGDNSIDGVISFVVASADLDINSVYGDISSINIDNIPSYNNKQATCTQYEEGYRCRFTNIKVKLSETSTIYITINLKDSVGNTDSTVLSKTIYYDNTGPSVTSIKTDKEDDGTYYAGSSTTFTVELDEERAGIDKKDIRLDLSNIKTGSSNKAADECASSGSKWTCYWYDIIADKSNGEKTISISGSDTLGNAITGTLSTTVTIDKTAPVVISSQVTPSGVGGEALSYIKTGDIIDITLKIREANKLRAYADFSSFVTTQDNEKGICILEGNEWTCTWMSDPINVPGHIIGDINFNMVDVAGNSRQYQKQIEVLNYDDAVNVSYWTSTVKCSPNLVDRQVTNIVNTRVYCSVTLNPTTPDQETLSINLGSCMDNLNDSLGYIENIALVNAERGSTEPYLAVDLIKGEMTISKLSVICPLQIISRVGTKINKEPEIEPIKVDIGFYNMPLGEYGAGVESKIQDAKDDAFGGLAKTIGFFKKLVGYSKLICNVLYMLHKLWLLTQVLTEGVTTAHIAMIGTPVEPILGASAATSCRADDTMKKLTEKSYSTKLGDKFCKFINCQASPKPPGSDKGGGGPGTFDDIATSIKEWNWAGNEALKEYTVWGSGTIEDYTGKKPYQYMNSRDNFFVALVTGCIPGIINGLDKYRQVQCLYADCIEQNAYNNVPVKICEDQKAYATCKYITGEIFALIPYTAFFDYYMGMIRNAFSDPLTAIATGINILFKTCEPICDPSIEGSIRWRENQRLCRGLQFAALLGEIINDVEGIIDSYEQIKGDYCERLDED